MKEALEMVKTQLGPDAIILSARDNNKSFGLVGEGSVEITAAVSEETLQRKRFVESRLRTEDREKLLRSPARVQKQMIDQMVNSYIAGQEEKAPRTITRTRYIEIEDEQQAAQNQAVLAAERIRGAAQRALTALQDNVPEPEPRSNPIKGRNAKPTAPMAPGATRDRSEISALKGEIAGLKQLIAQFREMPQNILAGQHPGASYGLRFEVSEMFDRLIKAGIAESVAAEILTEAQQQMPALKLKNKALVEAWTAKYILNSTQVVTDKQVSKIHVFVGPAGSGKTSTLIKMASHYVVQENKKVALVTLDTMKVGAADQMRIYAQILNVPFAIVRQRSDWDKIMAQLSGYDHILVDSPGLSLKSMEEISLIRQLLPPDQRWSLRTHLVLSCLGKDSDLTEIGKRYKVTEFQDVIFTGLDESNQHGTIYNFMRRFSTPLHSFGIGSRVPEDYEVATRERVLDLIFKITKMNRVDQQG